MPGKRIVILGGGFGGAAAARTLRKLLDARHTVTLVDRQRRTYLCGSLPRLIVGQRVPDKISRSLGSLVQRGVTYAQENIEGLDLDNRRVHTSGGVLPYDYLIVATGAEYDWDAVPGSSQAHSFYNLDTARRLRDALRRLRRGRIVIAVSSLPYKCPPAPYEAAMNIDVAFTERGIRRDVDIHVFTPEPSPLRLAGPEASAGFKAYLAGRGITLHNEQSLAKVDPDGRRAAFQSGETVDYDLLITVPVHRTAGYLRDAGLVAESGWIPVDSATLKTQHQDVFAVGDTTSLLMANGNPLPKAGVFASAEGETVARNLAAEIQGGQTSAFPGEGACFIDYGSGKGSMITGSFLAAERPRVSMLSPSVRWHRQKLRFERDWRRWKI